jgi:NAD(P)H-dependent flavin oxidoreductase YrpB (nitropropane dioxygenase family)
MSTAAALCDISVPVFQAGMAGLAGPDLVAAVSEAGGLGHLGGLRQPPSLLRQWIRAVKERTDRHFGVNLVPAYGGPEVFEAQLQVVFSERPRVLSLFYGDFTEVLPRAKAAGIVTMVQVGSLSEARRVAAAGADIIIAQGVEAGGHIRGRTVLSSLLPAIAEAFPHIPILAAGGIVDARSVRAARCLGADGAWVGTLFLATEESLAHDLYKRRLLRAGPDDTEFRTGYSFGWKYGTPHRVLPGRSGFNPLRLVSGGARRQDDPAMAEKLSLYAGSGVGRIRDIRPAAERVAALAAGFGERPANGR